MKKLILSVTALYLIMILVFCVVRLQAAIEIKIGSVAPERSPWHNALLKLARDWESSTGGQVKVRVYPGGIAGSEQDMIRKVRLGVLQGAVLTNMGMMKVERSVLVLNLPFLFNSDEEFNFVFQRLRPIFETRIEESGFKVIHWTQSGWVYFYSKGPVLNPDDLKKYKISITKDDPDLEQVWKKMGYQVVPQDQKDVLIGLESGMVSATYLPAVMAASGQYFAIASHMLAPKLSPLVGSLVLSRKTWEQIPENFRPALLEAAERQARALAGEITSLEEEAIRAMKEHGLVINSPSDGEMAQWREASSRAIQSLVGRIIPADIYEKTMDFIREYRARGNR
ncbi:MAG: TRAP-type C4-dicarboxylate transport system, periplasmic component [Candidatus Saccharicenans subterraneus]|uniref:TRAP-type C4-dicarboxylate transport system, periplasmic component n=1 Tax=Candidatus Saccharicenans subterraneus TaxID=2508984 RepID=A0A3E2BLW5_9BACT|nr:MAG: TRAP-type C4-dicarboxylate transport system, periplasmic component [Candidatus Saccharicenans subterraneum]